MKTNYWDYNGTIKATIKEKETLLDYEIDMFRKTCVELSKLDNDYVFFKNLLIESLATHTRTLLDFFYINKKNYDKDLIAQDLLPENIKWRELRPIETETLINAKNKANKQLAHLSLWRLKISRDNKKDWNNFNIILKEIEEIIKKFNEIKINKKS